MCSKALATIQYWIDYETTRASFYFWYNFTLLEKMYHIHVKNKFGTVLLYACCVLALILLVKILILVMRIVFPTIIKYPWPDNSTTTTTMMCSSDKERFVVLAGSFHPPHLGHINMIKYLSQRYGRVLLVIGCNPKKHYVVTPRQRQDLLRKALETESCYNVGVKVVSGYIWRTIIPLNADYFVRGIRSWEIDGQDERKLQIQNTWGPLLLGPLWNPVPTIFIQGDPKYNHISSTLVRNTIASDGQAALEELVPASIVDSVIKLYAKKLD